MVVVVEEEEGWGKGARGGGGNNLIDMFLLYDFHQSSLERINFRDMILRYDSTTISLLLMIIGTLIQDTGR